MSKPTLAFGLNMAKKPGASKPAAPKRAAAFGGDDDSDEGETAGFPKAETISGDLDDFGAVPSHKPEPKKALRSKNGPPTQPPKLKATAQTSTMFGDLSETLASRKNAEAASELDATVFEYDAVYDSLKPKKAVSKEDEERKPKYMRNLLQAAEVRKRDALIAEEKKIARDREAEGDEYEGKEKFVTEAYKKQQEENKRLEEEEKRKEEEEAKKNKGGGMSAFYRKLLDKDQERYTEAIKAADGQATAKTTTTKLEEEAEAPKEKTEADVAKELNDKGASIAVNDDGQVVDKRELLRGGLNLGAKKKESSSSRQKADGASSREAERNRNVDGSQIGRKQAMRERQSRMMAEQLEQSLKRTREADAAQRDEVERASKSRKTEGDISGARERYLARKKAAEEAKSKSG